MQTLYVDNDNDVIVDGLVLSDGTYANAATVTWALEDAAGAAVANGACVYKADSDGVYRGTIQDDVALTAGAAYSITITANAGTDQLGVWILYARAVARTA